jgi:hypothetical protein
VIGARTLVSFLAVGFASAGQAENLRINQIQVIGTHNSYHAGLTPGIAKLLQARKPKAAEELDYQHAPLTFQLDHGIRQVELDVYGDERGGRFARPFGAAFAPGGLKAFDPDGVMSKPGLKVMHIQDIDYISNCQPFVACLSEIRAWSRAHPNHVPVYILIETKTQEALPNVPGMASPEPWTATALDALDAEIRSVFPDGETITPDRVRGDRPTLRDAVTHGAWPRLSAARGKVVFLLDQSNVTAAYLAGHPSLKGRVAFTNADPAAPDAAFVEMNDGPGARITALVKQGFLVRTRADADTREARTGDTRRRDAALNSGAQIVSTDYPAFEPSRWTGYKVQLPGGASARCDPVNGTALCGNHALEMP